jgi:integrase
MSKNSKQKVVCKNFNWNVYQRKGILYADGRKNNPSVGRYSLGTSDRDEALRKLEKLDTHMAFRDKQLPNLLDQPKYREVSIAEGWDVYLKYVSRPEVMGGAGLKTQQRYRAVRDKHQQFCSARGIRTWNEITRKVAEAYGAHLAELKKSDATIYLEVTTLKQVVQFLIDEDGSLPPTHRIRLSLRRSRESHTFCPLPEQVRMILNHCANTPGLAWLGKIIKALAITGMRIGELSQLRWADVDIGASVITVTDNRHSDLHRQVGDVRTTKGRRGRRIPMHAELLALLKDLPRNPDGRVFHGPRGGKLKPDTVLLALKRDVIAQLAQKVPTPKNQVGFADCRVHSFRHFFVSQAFLGGASEGEIRQWVGHTDSRIIERYRHLSDQDSKRKMDRINFTGDGGASDGADHDGADYRAGDHAGVEGGKHNGQKQGGGIGNDSDQQAPDAA